MKYESPWVPFSLIGCVFVLLLQAGCVHLWFDGHRISAGIALGCSVVLWLVIGGADRRLREVRVDGHRID